MSLEIKKPETVRLKVGTEGVYLKTVVFTGEKLAETDDYDVLYITDDNRLLIHQYNKCDGQYFLSEISEKDLTDGESEWFKYGFADMIGVHEITIDEALADKDL